MSDSDDIRKIEGLRGGYKKAVDNQAFLAKSARQLMMSSALFPDESIELPSRERHIVEKCLSEIEELSQMFLLNMEEQYLKKAATKSYRNFFSANVDDHKLTFVIFYKTYSNLRQYWLDLLQDWRTIYSSIESSNLPTGSRFRVEILNYRIKPAMESCTALEIFCKRMSLLLGIENFASKNNDRGKYETNRLYAFSEIFNSEAFEKTETAVASPVAQVASASASTSNAAKLITSTKEATGSYLHDRLKRIEPAGSNRLNAGGTMPWNSTPAYFFSFDPNQLEEERKRLPSVIYFDTHLDPKDQIPQSQVVLKLSSKTWARDPGVIEQEYAHFLDLFFNHVAEQCVSNLNLPLEFRVLFLFHLGPAAFFSLIKKIMHDSKTGIFHRKVEKRNVIQKYIPLELLKKIFLVWWRDVMLGQVGQEKNDWMLYRKVGKFAISIYDNLAKKANQSYEALPEARKLTVKRDEMIRSYLDRHLGPANNVIFRRFIKL